MPAMSAMSADLNPNFGFVCEFRTLIKSCAKVSLYQKTTGKGV